MARQTLVPTTGSATHVGLVRDANEDLALVSASGNLWAVADGMGGHEAGALASETVVRSLETVGTPASAPDFLARVEDRLLRANARLQELVRERGRTLGATLVCLLVFDNHYACVWCGDSRLYCWRAGVLQQLSRDHTEVQEMVTKGILTEEEARRSPVRHVVTRAVGAFADLDLDLEQGEIEPGDVFVLCSDGLTAHVSDNEIGGLVRSHSPASAAGALVDLALERGGSDNVTVVVVRFDPEAGHIMGGE